MLRDETKTVAWEGRQDITVLPKYTEVKAYAKLLGITKEYRNIMGNTKLVNSLEVGMKAHGLISFPMQLLWSLRKAILKVTFMYHTFLRL